MNMNGKDLKTVECVGSPQKNAHMHIKRHRYLLNENPNTYNNLNPITRNIKLS